MFLIILLKRATLYFFYNVFRYLILANIYLIIKRYFNTVQNKI